MKTKSLKPRDKRDKEIMAQLWKSEQIARKISLYTGLNYEELRDAAKEYIVKIYSTWDGSKGANFSTWVNRCLNYHMMNYLRDHSRMIRIPRSYSDNYLKIRKLKNKDPKISNKAISEQLNIPLEKVNAIEQAFAIKINNNVEYANTTENSIFDAEIDADIDSTFSNYKDMLYRISSLEKNEEEFLVDHLVKKRSIKTLIKKYNEVNNANDIERYSNELINFILHG